MAIVASWPRNECQPVLAPMEAQEPDDIVVQETENKKRKATRDGRTDETKKRKKEKEEKKDKKDKKDKKEKKRKKKQKLLTAAMVTMQERALMPLHLPEPLEEEEVVVQKRKMTHVKLQSAVMRWTRVGRNRKPDPLQEVVVEVGHSPTERKKKKKRRRRLNLLKEWCKNSGPLKLTDGIPTNTRKNHGREQ